MSSFCSKLSFTSHSLQLLPLLCILGAPSFERNRQIFYFISWSMFLAIPVVETSIDVNWHASTIESSSSIRFNSSHICVLRISLYFSPRLFFIVNPNRKCVFVAVLIFALLVVEKSIDVYWYQCSFLCLLTQFKTIINLRKVVSLWTDNPRSLSSHYACDACFIAVLSKVTPVNFFFCLL